MTIYRINSFWKTSEEDVYCESILDHTMRESECGISMQANSTDDLIERVRQFFGVDSDALVLDSCEEQGRIDVSTLENSDGYQAAAREIELWKKGEYRLWTCTYTAYVQKCEPVSLRHHAQENNQG